MESGIIGKVIDSYKITAVLGKGGMGIVYKAQDMTLDRDVALKMMDAQLAADQNFLKRFQSEAKALAKLQNPGIVTIFALRETELGLCIVMEFVEGRTLADRIREGGAVPVNEAVPIFQQILSALSHAHDAGIVHRDIKPSNVMITPQGSVKVTDFGLAKIQQLTAVTVTVGTGGTLYYMSPEQVKGLANVDHRGDIYSLGMTLYEAVVGKIPFKDSDTDYSIRQAIVEGKIPPPDKFNPDLPKELVRVVMRSIEKEPSKRFQTAAEMNEALARLAPEAQKARRPEPQATVLEVPEKRSSSKRLILIGAGVVVAITLFFLIQNLLVPSTAMLAISTVPPGSLVVVDGQSVGITPVNYRAKPGTVRLQLQHEGFTSRDTSITVKEGDVLTLSIPMQKTSTFTGTEATQGKESQKTIPLQDQRTQDAPGNLAAKLIAQAIPTGSVSVDGNIKSGNSAAAKEIQVMAGDRVVTFQHPTYGSAKFTLSIRAGETKKLTCYFESYVSIQTLGESGGGVWGTIVVDGQNTGVQTPRDRYPLGPGRHLITVARSGYETVEGEKEVVVQPTMQERVIPLSFRLKKKPVGS
jgi:serine/threonine protein kinase